MRFLLNDRIKEEGSYSWACFGQFTISKPAEIRPCISKCKKNNPICDLMWCHAIKQRMSRQSIIKCPKNSLAQSVNHRLPRTWLSPWLRLNGRWGTSPSHDNWMVTPWQYNHKRACRSLHVASLYPFNSIMWTIDLSGQCVTLEFFLSLRNM